MFLKIKKPTFEVYKIIVKAKTHFIFQASIEILLNYFLSAYELHYIAPKKMIIRSIDLLTRIIPFHFSCGAKMWAHLSLVIRYVDGFLNVQN